MYTQSILVTKELNQKLPDVAEKGRLLMESAIEKLRRMGGTSESSTADMVSECHCGYYTVQQTLDN